MHWRGPLVADTIPALAPAGLTWGTMGLDDDCPCPVEALAVVRPNQARLLLLRRWTLPFGSLTILFGTVVGLVSATEGSHMGETAFAGITAAT